ncbi:MAG TPA: hypothetical protein VFS92_02615 [Planctomycetota bacterium]|nr:hypothetical protein [Planctomycetota bacterium]
MRIAVAAAALTIALGAPFARAQESPPGTPLDPDHRTSEERAAEAGNSDDLGRVRNVDEPFAPVEATRDSLRKPIPSL